MKSLGRLEALNHIPDLQENRELEATCRRAQAQVLQRLRPASAATTAPRAMPSSPPFRPPSSRRWAPHASRPWVRIWRQIIDGPPMRN